ncbi:MAG: hypothetical protein KAR15_19035, partial [Desulfobacterales bacterium]|nr:hypothetical protein [Desulfobacterales bacterium]
WRKFAGCEKTGRLIQSTKRAKLCSTFLFACFKSLDSKIKRYHPKKLLKSDLNFLDILFQAY